MLGAKGRKAMYLCWANLKKALRAIEISLVVPSTEMESLENTKQMGSDWRKGMHGITCFSN